MNKEINHGRRKFLGNILKAGALTSILPTLSSCINAINGKMYGNKNVSTDFSLEDLTDYWRFIGINYRNDIHQVDLAKTLQPKRTQDEHAEHRKQIIKSNSNEFYLPDYPLFHSMVSTLNQNKDNFKYKEKVEEARQFIKDSALNSWLVMLTRIQYNPKNQKDKVIHNYKQKDQYTIELDSFVGSDGYIVDKNAITLEEPLKVLLDTKQSIQEINQIYKWLTDKDAYIFRVNSERENTDERVAWFNIYSSRTGVGCAWFPSDSYVGLGMRTKNLED